MDCQKTQQREQHQRGEEFRDDLRRQGLPVEVVRRLSVINPLKATLAILHTCGGVAICVAAALTWWTPWVVIPAMVVIASRQQALFVLAHDAAHYRMFNSRWLNEAIGRACGAVVGVSMCTYRVVHRLHHNYLYEAQDPDIPLHGGYPRGRVYLLKKLTRDLLGLTAWKTYKYFFGAPVINDEVEQTNRPLNDTSPRLRRTARQDRWLVVSFHVAAPVVAFVSGYGVAYVLLWLLPLVTILQPILRFRAICEHGAVTNFASPLTADSALQPGRLPPRNAATWVVRGRRGSVILGHCDSGDGRAKRAFGQLSFP
ncbi:fatty acid desaturase [Candidatus Entotheonella serta]|nr:fatty acid desaturase [Candidatus Entotheonella serta]